MRSLVPPALAGNVYNVGYQIIPHPSSTLRPCSCSVFISYHCVRRCTVFVFWMYYCIPCRNKGDNDCIIRHQRESSCWGEDVWGVENKLCEEHQYQLRKRQPQASNDKPVTGFLMEDSGYMLRDWLLIPLTNYHQSYPRTTVERSIGVVKRRWHCLRWLRVAPVKTCQMITFCFMRHNRARLYALPDAESDD